MNPKNLIFKFTFSMILIFNVSLLESINLNSEKDQFSSKEVIKTFLNLKLMK